jgi:hypothetical protein
MDTYVPIGYGHENKDCHQRGYDDEYEYIFKLRDEEYSIHILLIVIPNVSLYNII